MTLNRLFTTLFMVVWWGSLGYCFWLLYINDLEWQRERSIQKAVANAKKLQAAKQNRAKKRFVYCDGRKGATVYVEFVTDDEFNAYENVPYALIDINNRSAYFDVHRYMNDNS